MGVGERKTSSKSFKLPVKGVVVSGGGDGGGGGGGNVVTSVSSSVNIKDLRCQKTNLLTFIFLLVRLKIRMCVC